METRASAFHEAGHIVAAWHFGFELREAWIDRESGQANHRGIPGLADDHASCEVQAIIFRAGLIAERIHHGGGPAATASAWDDLQRLKVLASVVEPVDCRPFYSRVVQQTRSLLEHRE